MPAIIRPLRPIGAIGLIVIMPMGTVGPNDHHRWSGHRPWLYRRSHTPGQAGQERAPYGHDGEPTFHPTHRQLSPSDGGSRAGGLPRHPTNGSPGPRGPTDTPGVRSISRATAMADAPVRSREAARRAPSRRSSRWLKGTSHVFAGRIHPSSMQILQCVRGWDARVVVRMDHS
jgi:hypothetical protein